MSRSLSLRRRRARIVGRWTAGVALTLLMALSSCSSAEKYKKSENESDTGPVQGEMALQIPAEAQGWLRDLTGRLDAAELTCALGDTTSAVHLADSLLRTVESVVDTLDMGSPLQRALLLIVADGYGRIMAWESDPDVKAALTQRHSDLAARLQHRLDSVKQER